MNVQNLKPRKRDVDCEKFTSDVATLVEAARFLSGGETKVLLNIMALSAGHEPQCVSLSLQDLMDLTDLSEGTVRRALNGLECRGVLYYTPHSSRIARTYWVDTEMLAIWAETKR